MSMTNMSGDEDVNVQDNEQSTDGETTVHSESEPITSIAEVSAEDVNDTLNSIKVDVKDVKLKPLKGDIPITELYSEFSEFLRVKSDLLPDSGIKLVVPTPIKILNAYIGGGFPIGSLSIIVGSPGSGKSMLAIQTISSGQITFPNFLANFLDSEEATTSARLSNLGVRNPCIQPYNDCTIEKVFKHLEAMCVFKELKKMNKVPSALVWDSIANTLSQKEIEAQDVNQVIGFKAKLLSLLVPKYVAKCAQYSIAWIAINQLREELNISAFTRQAKDLKYLSTGKTLPGGQSLKYNAFTLLEMKPGLSTDFEKRFGFNAVVSKCKTVKCKLFPPNNEVNLVGSFTTGFSDFWTSFMFLVDMKRISTGAWYSIEGCKDRFRAKDAENLYKTDPSFKTAFDIAVDEVIKDEIMSKVDPIN